MAKVLNNDEAINAGDLQQPTQATGFGGADIPPTGGSFVNEFEQSFGWSSTSSMANDFVLTLNEVAKTNTKLSRFRYGLVEGISPEMGSAAYVAGEYNGAWLYGLIFFEKGQSLRFYETPNRVETYYTLTGLINQDVLNKVQASLSAVHGISNGHFIVINAVPDFADAKMTPEWAQSLMGQILLGIFGRIPGYMGALSLKKSDKFVASVAAPESGVAVDVNGHPHRADFAVYLEHTPSQSDSNTPTLLSESAVNAYPPVRGAGFVNLRFTGLKKDANGVVSDLKQLQGEVVATLIDSQVRGAAAPLQRQFIALAAYVKMAQNGGWRERLIETFNTTDRKFSSLAGYLSWGQEAVPDLSKMDKSKEQISQCLTVFAPAQAALVVHHRGGNGVGGLSNIIAEVAQGNSNALVQLLAAGNSVFSDKDHPEAFSTALATAFGRATLTREDVVAAAVPTIDGAYVDGGQRRSSQSMDLVAVVTALGDKKGDVYRYLKAQSYNNRELASKEQRLYMARMALAMYGNRSLRITGEALDMAINPTFARVVLDLVEKLCQFQLNGVNAYNELDNSLFYAGNAPSLVISGAGGSGAFSDFGLGVELGSLKL